MSAALGWMLAAAAVAAGYTGYGWRGLLLALTVVVFWLVLQFNRAARAMRAAARQPVGHVANAVMLNARLQRGMLLQDVLLLTHSLGRKLADEPEAFVWHDAAGDAVHVHLQGGRVSRWQLHRGASGPQGPGPTALK